jgi:predicted DCC family thiol-disulfide oxidoreductase YuxK
MDLVSKQPEARPVLVYDGDCAFCVYWARYWHALTGDRVRYAPYQQVAADYPGIPLQAFRDAVQYIAPDGSVASGAEASLLTLSHAPGKGFWIRLYRRLPGFAWAGERSYAAIAAHRPLAFRISRMLWGAGYQPPQHQLAIGLFLRCLALIFLAAFVSLGVQVVGLVGAGGILPLTAYLAGLQQALGWTAYLRFPSLFWLGSGDTSLQVACAAGAVLSLSMFVGVMPRVMLPLMVALYLSLFYAGQVFTQFQWDLLLIETGFLAIALQTGSKVALWLGRWLLFRFIFLSGAVKLLSGDPTWADLTALYHHFETQPLPTPLAWHAHHLPHALLEALAAGHFAIELGLVFLIFLPRRLRFVAAWAIIALQAVIIATGNYNFFNLLVLALTLLLFDDAALKRVVPRSRLERWVRRASSPQPGRFAARLVAGYAVVVMAIGLTLLWEKFQRRPAGGGLHALMDVVAPLRAVNPYGVFAHMVSERMEIVVEGSPDGIEWREYRFRYKPGDVTQAPHWVLPHQPRLDWQMWFAALGEANESPWVARLLARLLANSPEVLALLADNPFPDGPPVAVRASLYRYRFSDAPEKQRGIWWERELAGMFYPAVGKAEMDRASERLQRDRGSERGP